MPVYRNKKNNTFYFKTYVNGRQVFRRGFFTKKEALLAEAQANTQKNKRLSFTFVDYLDEYSRFIKASLKITYYANVQNQIRSFYSKLFPDVLIEKLTYRDVVEARKKILDKNICNQRKNRARGFLISFFEWIHTYYGFDFIEIKKMQKFKDYSIHKMKDSKADFVELDDFKKIYNSCDSSFYRLAFLTFYLFGLRIGELLALKVDAIDFKNKTMEIYQAVSFKTGNGSYVLIPPKSKSSERVYFLPDNYVELLQEHVKKYSLKQNSFIFFQSKNKNAPCPEQTFRSKSNHYCRLFSPEFHFHALRKSTVTYLSDKGVSLSDISKYVGHASPEITKNVYLQESQKKNETIKSIMSEVIKDIKV